MIRFESVIINRDIRKGRMTVINTWSSVKEGERRRNRFLRDTYTSVLHRCSRVYNNIFLTNDNQLSFPFYLSSSPSPPISQAFHRHENFVVNLIMKVKKKNIAITISCCFERERWRKR